MSQTIAVDGQNGLAVENPLLAASELPFQAPDFRQIADRHYQPAIEAGMAEQSREIRTIAEDEAPPAFDNTVAAMERTGVLFGRAMAVFSGVAGANTNDTLQRVRQELAPKLAAHGDAILLDARLFARVKHVYERRDALQGEARRLVEVTYRGFVHAGANLSQAEKADLKALNEEESTLSNEFLTRLLAATRDAAYETTDRRALAGMTERQIQAAQEAARERGLDGYALALQNTTQQPWLVDLTIRETRQAVFERSWNRTERGGANDTREIVARLARLRARKATLLGASSYAAWALQDQMAKTPDTVLRFLDGLVPDVTARARQEAADLQESIQRQGARFPLEPWDWNFYQQQLKKERFDIDEAEAKPYFELNSVLRNGVFYAAETLYGLRFEERNDLPVYHPDVKVFQVLDVSGIPLALFYYDPFKRDNKNGGAWMGEFVGQSRLMGTSPVVYNVTNFTRPAAGEAALLSFDDVTTMFHEFGHGLHGIFADAIYPSLSGTAVPRDFVEFPSQFNERWASYPAVFDRYARHYRTGDAMPEQMAARLKSSVSFNRGYRKMEVLAAARLDMQWHTLGTGDHFEDTAGFEQSALAQAGLAMREIPPRYRTTYFAHVWGGGYAAGYYAYLWSESLEERAWQWFEANGGMTRANGQRFRTMVLARGNTEDLETMFARWLDEA